MDNFDLKKYLAEGKLAESDSSERKEELQPILDVIKSKNYITNLYQDGNYRDATWPQGLLFWNTELPKKDGSKGFIYKEHPYASGWVNNDPNPAETKKDYDIAFSPGVMDDEGGYRFYAKDKSILENLKRSMPNGNWSPIKPISAFLISPYDSNVFEKVNYFGILLK